MCAEVLNGCNYLIFGTQTRQDWYIYIYIPLYIYIGTTIYAYTEVRVKAL